MQQLIQLLVVLESIVKYVELIVRNVMLLNVHNVLKVLNHQMVII